MKSQNIGENIMPNCVISQNFCGVGTILKSLKEDILTYHIYIWKLGQDRLHGHIPQYGIQSVILVINHLFFNKKYYF